MLTISNADKDSEHSNACTLLAGTQNGTASLEKFGCFFIRLKHAQTL